MSLTICSFVMHAGRLCTPHTLHCLWLSTFQNGLRRSKYMKILFLEDIMAMGGCDHSARQRYILYVYKFNTFYKCMCWLYRSKDSVHIGATNINLSISLLNYSLKLSEQSHTDICCGFSPDQRPTAPRGEQD